MTANLRNIFANSVIVLYKSHKRVINKTKHCITVTEWKNDKNKYNVDWINVFIIHNNYLNAYNLQNQKNSFIKTCFYNRMNQDPTELTLIHHFDS